jgi:hypothetical protein
MRIRFSAMDELYSSPSSARAKPTGPTAGVAVDRGGWLGGDVVGLEEVPDAAGEVAFEAAHGFAVGFAFGLFAGEVGGGVGVVEAFAECEAM